MKRRSRQNAVKVKIVRENGRHCVKEVWGGGWRTIVNCSKREKALMFLEKCLNDKLTQWSREVKMRAGWVCEQCGELDLDLLESHHIKPRERFPELMYEISNGKCLCMWCHAFKHKGIIRDHILARLAIKLYGRLYPEKFKEKTEEKNQENDQEKDQEADRFAEAFC